MCLPWGRRMGSGRARQGGRRGCCIAQRRRKRSGSPLQQQHQMTVFEPRRWSCGPLERTAPCACPCQRQRAAASPVSRFAASATSPTILWSKRGFPSLSPSPPSRPEQKKKKNWGASGVGQARPPAGLAYCCYLSRTPAALSNGAKMALF